MQRCNEKLKSQSGRPVMKSSFANAAAAALLFALSGLAQAGNSVLIITHEVKDFAAWKVGYDNDKPTRQGRPGPTLPGPRCR
jgi:hypothetical protein